MSEVNDDWQSLQELLDVYLAVSIAPAELSPGERGGLRGRLMQRVQASGAGLRTVRAARPDWVPASALTEFRNLQAEEGTTFRTIVFRMQPGGEVPAHAHRFEEETFVIEGEIEVGGEVLRAGDYQFAAPGSFHETIRSPAGATLLVRFQTRAGT
jgi:quercetin dioxygenase-like cupin family protein